MNLARSTRYHRARRRAGFAALAIAVMLLAVLLLTDGSVRLRDVSGGRAGIYVLLLGVVHAAATFPLTWLRDYRLEHQYGLSHPKAGVWLRDYLVAGALLGVPAAAFGESLYAAMHLTPGWWWLVAALCGVALRAVLVSLSPMLLLPRLLGLRPLERGSLRGRIDGLARQADLPAVAIHEWRLGARNRRARAALVGASATRTILLSDTLLADYSEDEIEAVLAHELGHHVHRDVLKGLLAELLVLCACLYAAGRALQQWWGALGLTSPRDVAGLPLILLSAVLISLLARPLVNALSRRSERRADRFALALTRRPDAFISAIRRMAAQNLVEERPSRLARLLFHTHPSVEERIETARRPLSLDGVRTHGAGTGRGGNSGAL